MPTAQNAHLFVPKSPNLFTQAAGHEAPVVANYRRPSHRDDSHCHATQTGGSYVGLPQQRGAPQPSREQQHHNDFKGNTQRP